MLKITTLIALTLVSALSVAAEPSAPAPETRLLRFPTTDGTQIVFSYAGQLYTVAKDGGTARRLTSGPGYAIFPHFSPDGATLAFTAQYDGNTEVYVMPSAGGTPTRLTYTATLGRDDLGDRMGPNNIVMAWKNTSPQVVFRSRMASINDFVGQLYSVGMDADLPKQLPVPAGGFLSFSPDDSKMAYNQVFREFRTWKQYRGGMADDIWIFDFKTGSVEDITNNPAQDIIPMWAPNNHIYFLSDRDGRLNLFSYDLATKATRQHTHFKDFDIKFPSLGKGAVVFEEAGYLWRFDLDSETAHRVPISVQEDFADARPQFKNVSKFVTEVSPASDGNRAVVVARGDLFTVPAKNGPVRNLTDTSAIHERGASWSPDGKWIAYLADPTGENEVYIRPQDGRGEPVQLTKGATTYYYNPIWSPDSTKLIWGDRLQRIQMVDIATKAVTQVAHNPELQFDEYAWSPDSRWIAYTEHRNATSDSIDLYSLATGQTTVATESWFNAGNPAFSDDGKYLLFQSSRDYHPIYSDTEWNHAYDNMQRVYVLALAKDTPSPLKPQSDEVEAAPEKKPSDAKDTKSPSKPETKVDLDGLTDRLVGLPIMPANYSGMRMVGDHIYYLRMMSQPVDANEGAPPSGTLALYDIKERKETELGQVEAFELTADSKKMLVKSGPDYAIIDLPTSKIDIKEKLNLTGLQMHLDRSAEWSQIYYECWRQMRDYFYTPTMQGIDWPAMRDKYATLLPYVRSRYDLTYLIGELIGELHIGHSYTGGGDVAAAPRIPMGLLGAQLSRDSASRAYRVDKILKGENWENGSESPLTEIGVNVSEGDYILAVDGKPVSAMKNIYASLIGTAGKQVVLTVSSKASGAPTRDVTVVPTGNEFPLYYHTWVEHNTETVASRTGGQVGYIHIPDMEPNGLDEFIKHFYPQLTKRALIIDDRGNGGGNVSPMIAERLRRELVMLDIDRNGEPTRNPNGTFVGPKVLLINKYSASDGDIFPFRFRSYHLGKLIGERTWGGVIGIQAPLPISDGGFVTKPEFAPYALDGSKWLIESHGVEPDIEVHNDPSKEFAGDDQQLDRAIEEVMNELKTTKGPTLPLPGPPPWPDRH